VYVKRSSKRPAKERSGVPATGPAAERQPDNRDAALAASAGEGADGGEHAALAEAPPPFRGVAFTLSSIGYAVARHFKKTLAPLRLEPREFALLRAVGVAEGQSQQAIGERLQIPASRMVAFVDALEGRGLVERRANPQDRRSWALHLTRDGREVLESALGLAIELERHICEDLSEHERESLLDMLQRIGARLGVSPNAHAAHSDATGGPPCEDEIAPGTSAPALAEARPGAE
ncbi:MAG: MarR family transcriptional regulator, partial [Acidobacteriota bacterium]|nr:MarR family transcriptional regulator [Acidobacteriota bacterium]